MAPNPHSIALTGAPAIAPILLRVSPSRTREAAARQAMQRYWRILQADMPLLTQDQAGLICDVCRNWPTAQNEPYLWAQIADSLLANSLSKTWDVHSGFVTFIQGLSISSSVALVDAAERFWQIPNASLENLDLLPSAGFCIH